MNKHTPGPWEAEEDEVFDKVSYQITSGHRLIAELFMCSGGWDEYEANARLIAATPEMLEALGRIEALHCNLRYGGPAPEDLQSLSDALEEACNTASDAISLATRGRSHD